MLRSIAKTCLACAYTYGLAPRLNRARRKFAAMPFIVGYHRIVEDFEQSKKGAIPSMLTSTAMLERHIDWLSKRFSFLSLDEIGAQLESGRPFQKPAVAITLDDGYADVYHNAFPLFKKKGIPAAVFVVTGLVGTGRLQIFDRFHLLLRLLQKQRQPLASTVAAAFIAQGFDATPIKSLKISEQEPFRLMTRTLNSFRQEQVESALAFLEGRFQLHPGDLEQMVPLTWEMIGTMQRQGMTIASHTVSHRLLASETIETVRAELTTSKRVLEERIGTTVNHFAYPDGRFNSAVIEAVQNAGYRYAYGNCLWRDGRFPLLTIPRKVLWERSCVSARGEFSPAIMNCQADWLFDRRDRCDHDHTTI